MGSIAAQPQSGDRGAVTRVRHRSLAVELGWDHVDMTDAAVCDRRPSLDVSWCVQLPVADITPECRQEPDDIVDQRFANGLLSLLPGTAGQARRSVESPDGDHLAVAVSQSVVVRRRYL